VLALLQSGIPLDLPHEKQLSMTALSAGSPLIGRPIQSSYLDMGEDEFEIMAVFRQGDVLLPHPDTVLREGDRILVVTTPRVRARVLQSIAVQGDCPIRKMT
jgi:Trk K+ transport system NAD-binding subunit